MARIELANGWEAEDKHSCIDAYRQGVKGDWFIRFWYRDGGGFDSREAALRRPAGSRPATTSRTRRSRACERSTPPPG